MAPNELVVGGAGQYYLDQGAGAPTLLLQAHNGQILNVLVADEKVLLRQVRPRGRTLIIEIWWEGKGLVYLLLPPPAHTPPPRDPAWCWASSSTCLFPSTVFHSLIKLHSPEVACLSLSILSFLHVVSSTVVVKVVR